ncbi:uncharacterized protein LOC111197179 [Astyanax mexicanus]|uniref:uncharacterized protein LOC111197179 n=1 Tax=Astyanax mexicanus TaxID=7994 RepID=UPI000BBD9B01|nr:uncharacterized protein LOC111197179 [Astyanax mexicanus]
MFNEWEELDVSLDVWHLMQRFAAGLTTDSHQIYGLFMANLSVCIFVWDVGDMAHLHEAMQAELEVKQHIVGLTEVKLISKLTTKQIARHGRHSMRRAEGTELLISQLLVTFRNVTDTMGIPLLDTERRDFIWNTQQQHLRCIQDPLGLQLYSKTRQLTRSGVVVPVYRCARGITSLESFHHHLNYFTIGTYTNTEYFQAFLLERLTRWNEDCADAVEDQSGEGLRRYNGHLQHSLKQLSQLPGQSLGIHRIITILIRIITLLLTNQKNKCKPVILI